MIVPFTIDPDIFSTSPDGRLDLAKHKQLIRLWRNYGVLVIPGAKRNESRIFKALQASDQRIKALWTNSFKQCTQDLENSSVDEALKKSEFNKLSSQKIKLWSIDESKDELLGIERESHSKIIRNNEICMFGYEQYSQAFEIAEQLSNKVISDCDDPDKTWRERILPLAKYSNNITVCDRYLINQFWQSKGNRYSGIERLIQNLANMNTEKSKNLHIYSTNLIGNKEFEFKDIENKFNEFCSAFKNKSIREINLNLITISEYRRLFHYRMIMFDDHHVITSDSGLEILGDEGKNKSHDFNLKHLYDDSSRPFKDDLKRLVSSTSFQKRIELSN
jgi:hypothetical protein